MNSTQRGWLNDNGVIYFALIGYPYYMYGWPAQFDLSTSVLDTGAIIVSPSISLTPETLSPSVDEGLIPASQSFGIWNSGGGSLTYSISDNAAWLSCIPANGSSTGEQDTITVAYDTASLAPGNYSGTITISDPAADNSPRTIPVALTVQGSTPDISITPASFQNMIFSYPFDSPGQVPRGLAFDGTHLWHADSSTDKIYKLDLTGQVIQTFDTFGTSPVGLAFDGTNLWLADSSADMVRKFYSIPGPVEIGKTENVLFTVQNVGDADLETSSLYITGPDAADFTITDDLCSDRTIPMDDQCTVTVTFSPDTPGEKSADLEIPSNDPDTPILVVPLDSTALGFNPDLDRDGDTDGKDIAAFIAAFDPLALDQVALVFGR